MSTELIDAIKESTLFSMRETQVPLLRHLPNRRHAAMPYCRAKLTLRSCTTRNTFSKLSSECDTKTRKELDVATNTENPRDGNLAFPSSDMNKLLKSHYTKKINPMLFNSSDAALMLAISKRKLWELTNTGELTCVRIDRLVRYTAEDLRNWIDSRRRGGK